MPEALPPLVEIVPALFNVVIVPSLLIPLTPSAEIVIDIPLSTLKLQSEEELTCVVFAFEEMTVSPLH